MSRGLQVRFMAKRVVVGMSGGVDSAVAASLLKEQGYDVIGLYMSNWKDTDPDGCCTGEQDWSDVARICEIVGVPYYSVDFSEQYMERVFSLFVDEYRKGRTPNPDVLCNREVKFGPFVRFARELGADFIATGHYCDILHENGRNFLLRSADENKDQTYFLNQVTERQLDDVMFPLGHMVKTKSANTHALTVYPLRTRRTARGFALSANASSANFFPSTFR